MMNSRQFRTVLVLSVLSALSGFAAPVVDPIPDVTIPAGRSLIVPVTGTSPSGRPLTYTVTSSTNAIAVVMHTNNPFWQLSVAQAAPTNAPGSYPTPYRGGLVTVTNVGNMTFMLFPEYATHAVNVFQGLTTAGFYNSNTIFHRVINDFMIQGGDANTNGSGRLVFECDDEFHPQAMFTGSGQLAVANHGKDTGGAQFFVTTSPQRRLDFGYTIFGQLVRGFDVLTNISHTATGANDRPLADEIIQTASYVPNTADTVLTLTATNLPGVTGTITVIASDGAGGQATNVFAATLVLDTNSNHQPFFYPNTVTNLVAPLNRTLTNFLNALELGGDKQYWSPYFYPDTDYVHAPNSSYNLLTNRMRDLTYNVTNVDGVMQLFLVPANNYAGTVSLVFDVSPVDPSNWSFYQQLGWSLPVDEQTYTFVFGDTPIAAQGKTVSALGAVPFYNAILATFTNGVPGSSSTNFTASINWGDNSTNSGMVVANAAGEKAVLGSHTYVNPGTYPVYVRVQSAIGASATALSFVTVTNPAAAATNLLTVQVTGQGTVSPNYSNASLPVGSSYTISASPADLWVLTGWTDGNGYVLGTGTNLTFTMYPGLRLTANFSLAGRPSLRIVSPSTNRVITNLYSSPAIVTGTASNNATITRVWYQVNSGGWREASGTTDWTASFAPAYGITNRFQAYAVNNYGFVSTTSAVSVVYLAGAVLAVITNGPGGITPALNGQLLPLGSNYVLKAAPTVGCRLVNWTDGAGSTITNGAAMRFVMSSNLTFRANFVDTNRPTLSIVTPTANQKWSNAVFAVAGKASDNIGVTNVFTSLNGREWLSAVLANNRTNWTMAVSLAPKTNTLRAYAVDAAGNNSATNSVSFVYVVSDRVRVQITGQGTLTPNYSNAMLEIGQGYSIKASGINGHTFTNWAASTNWGGSQITTNATLSFIMQSNLTLQANFMDTNRPTLSITAPTANQKWSNAVFTVRGTSKDNAKVTEVWCQTNGVWGPASVGSAGTNWTMDVALMRGTNTVRAYAVDGTGNRSLTNSVSFVYVLSDRLQVRAVGQGTLTPNYSNAMLEIGMSYSMKASGANGHAFTNWVVSTNWVGGMTTNNATLNFVMQSNLTLQASFVDTNKPVLAIIAPTASQRWSNAVFTVKGTAKDNAQISKVWCLTNGNWGLAITTNNWTNWTMNLALAPKTNTIQAYAEDAAGNKSPTNTVKLIYVVSDRLTLITTGRGTVSPNYSNAVLEIGTTNTLTATPGAGCVFSNWMGSVLGTVVLSNSAAKLSFVMQSNLVLRANIITNPFTAWAGSYYGLAYDRTSDMDQAGAGFFSGTIGSAGAFSAKLVFVGRTNSITGQFDLGGHLAATVPQAGGSPLALDLQLGPDTLSGTVSIGDRASTLDAYRSVFNTTTNPCPYAGRYTLAVPGAEGIPQLPEGSGYGAVTVDKGGNAVLSGMLADGTAMGQSVPVSKYGDWPLYVLLYSGKGAINAWLRFTLPAGLTNTMAAWVKPTNSLSKYYADGFTNLTQIAGSPYVYAKTSRVLALTNGVVVFSGGNLALPVTNLVLLTATNQFLNQGTNPMAITLNTNSGLLSGWFKVPGAARTNQFYGVLLQEQIVGDGYFLGTNASGRVLLIPAP